MLDEQGSARNSPGSACIRVRGDLNCWLHKSGGKPYYLIEDPISTRYFRVGLREWKLASFFDGKIPLSAALASLKHELGDKCLSEAEALAFGRWLVNSQLAAIEGMTSTPLASNPSAATSALKNPFFIRIPLINPDRLLESLLPKMSWMLGRGFLVVWIVLCVTGAYRVFADWDRFAAATAGVLAPHNWIYLIVAWLLLKIVHETFHGLVCKKYGGTVPCAGVVLILFSPVAFVDVTSSWRFRSKWPRIFTAVAGMYIEFGIAAVAAIVWSQTSAGVLSHLCHSIVFMASLTTLLFNANPLMRFDGYYILTDLMEIQNLYTSGRQYLRYFFRRYFFGTTATLPAWSPAKRTFITLYAWASLFWRLMVSVSMAAIAATLFHGAGLVLTAIAAVMWFGLPTVRFLKYLVVGDVNGRPPLLRFLIMSAGCVLLVLGLLSLPWPGGVTAPGIVEYAPLDVIRTSRGGFVSSICVKSGQRVEKGQALAVLVHEETTRELDDLNLAIQQSVIKSRILHRREEMARYQAEGEQRRALIKQTKQLEKQVRELTPRALRAGRIIGRDLDLLVGQYLESGKSLFAVGAEQKKEIRLSISEDDVEAFMKSIDTFPWLRVRGRAKPIRKARLAKIEPRASVAVHHAALGADAGGPLAVRSVSTSDSSDDGPETELQFVRPRFTGIIDLPAGIALQLRAGELVQARLTDHDDTIGRHLYQTVSRWLRKKLRRGSRGPV